MLLNFINLGLISVLLGVLVSFLGELGLVSAVLRWPWGVPQPLWASLPGVSPENQRAEESRKRYSASGPLRVHVFLRC